MSAIISACGLYRYRLERDVQLEGLTYAYFGVNPSTADATIDDATVRKWIGFTKINRGRRFIVGNAFAFRSTDVKKLPPYLTAIGPENNAHIDQLISDADIVVPCWGSTDKVPRGHRPRFDAVMARLLGSGKPVKIFGRTKSGDPMHPLMLAYSTELVDWRQS